MCKENELENPKQDFKAMDYEDVLKKIAFGRIQWLLPFICGLILLMASNEVLGMGMIAIASKCDFNLSSIDKGVLTGVGYLGNCCATYMWGYLSDTIGRRPIIIYSTIIGNFISLLSMFISNFWIFIVLRFLVGFSICGATTVVFAYLGEFYTDYHRPIVLNYACLFNAISCLYVAFVTWLVLLMDWSFELTENFHFHPWRLLLLFYLLPGFIGALILFALPESPKFLLAKSEHDKAYDALNWIYKKNGRGESLETLNIFEIKIPATEKVKNFDVNKERKCFSVFYKIWQDIRPLFQSPHVGHFLVCCVVMCSVFMCAVGLGIWFPEIQNRLSMDTNPNKKAVCDVINKVLNTSHESNVTVATCDSTIANHTYIDYTILGSICTLSYLILGGIINIFGRRTILISFLAICGLSGIALLGILSPIGIVLCFSLFLVLSELSMSIVSSIVVDLVPTHLRGQAICFVYMIGRLGSAIATNFVGVMLETKCAATFLTFSVFSLVCAILSYFLPI